MEKLNKRTLELESDNNSKDDKGNKKKWFPKSKKSKFKKLGFQGKIANDASWHTKNVQMLKDLFTIAFNKMAGFPIWLKSNLKTRPINIGYIRTFFVDWFAGVSYDFRSMLNTAATNIWEFIRSRNAGAVNYQSADIFINIMFGCLDIMSTSNYLARFFKIARMFKVRNRLLPRKLFEGMKVDYDDFVKNESIYRGRYNILLAKASAIVVPKQFPIYDWVLSQWDNIYVDRDGSSGREQVYLNVKEAFHIFDKVSRPTGGEVRLMDMQDIDPSYPQGRIVFNAHASMVKFETLLDIWEAQINAIITDEDCNIIFGDLIKAYGSEGNFWKTQPITESDTIDLTYSEEYLMQLHNAIILPPQPDTLFSKHTGVTELQYSATAYLNEVFQDSAGFLRTEFWKSYTGDTMMTTDKGHVWYDPEMDYLLDTNEENPSPEKVCLMTRYHNRFKWDSTDERLYVDASSAVILSEGEIISISDGMLANVDTRQMLTSPHLNSNFQSDAVMDAIALNSNFDWAPIIYQGRWGSTDTDLNHIRLFADINNVVNISSSQIARMHEVDYASLYDVPFSGKF